MNLTAINAIFDGALRDGRDVLLDTEGLQLLAALGLPAPAFLFVTRAAEIDADLLARLPGAKAVVKVVSPQILHKSDVGGVAIVEKTGEAVAAAIARMDGALGTQGVVGYTINEFVPYSPALGRELLVGLRWTEDVGPVVTVGAGGIHTEFLAKAFRPGQDVALFAPALADAGRGRGGAAAGRGGAAGHAIDARAGPAAAARPDRGSRRRVPGARARARTPHRGVRGQSVRHRA